MPRGFWGLVFGVVLLVLATTSQGAFAVSRWAPVAMLVLAILAGAVLARRGRSGLTPATAIMLAGLWGLAAWCALSMLWAQSASAAWVAANRTILYAAVATLPFALRTTRRALAVCGWVVSVGIGAIALVTLIRLLAGETSLFLAGRLDGPINYRNATALLFAMPVWPFVIVAATRDYRPVIRGVALSSAMLCLGLAFLTQSRGIVVGLAIGGILVLTAGPDRVRRAWTAILLLAGVAGASSWLLRPFHAFHGGHGFVSAHDIAVAARGLTVLSLVAFVVGLMLAILDKRLGAESPATNVVRQGSRLLLAGVVVLAIAGGLVAVGNPTSFAQRKWDEFRSLQSTTPTSTRLISTGGQRYDLWRVALKEFRGAPLRGVGADNYAFGYYRYRVTNRNLNDPHSLVFALLSENGIVGLALLLVFLAAAGVAVMQGWNGLDATSRRHCVAPAAAGLVMFGQSMVDWMWLIPGVAALGVLLVALAAAQATPVGEESLAGGARSPLRTPLRVIALALLIAAGISVGAVYLSDAYLRRARSAEGHPASELAAARTAAALNPFDVTPLYLEASAYESTGRRAAALTALRGAHSLEPANAATLGVLGDFEARAGNLTAARSYYRRALALNPRDTGLQQLAKIGLHATRPAPR